MTFETLKRNHLKRNILIAVAIVFILSAIILTFTRAKYKLTESMPLLNGTINYTLADLNVVAMYVDGSEVDALPNGNFVLTSESYCTNEDGEKDESITISYDSATQGLSVSPLTKKGTKCYLYFEEKLCPEGATVCDTIVAASRPQGQTTDWTGQTTYYYTGANPNNWVQFGGFWWRIIRINGDGSIRMIYAGTNRASTNDDTIGTSAFNNSSTNKTYVGLVYDGSTQHGSGSSSTIMTNLNNWYNNNLASYETDYIDTGIGFCSDRNMASGSNFDSSNIAISYAPAERTSSGSLQCNELDILSQDNGKIPNPIGLLTSDEYVLAGSRNSYLNIRIDYWSMSPCIASHYIDSYGALVFNVDSNGYLSSTIVDFVYGVRPVINIRANVSLTGSGITSDPFKIVGAS